MVAFGKLSYLAGIFLLAALTVGIFHGDKFITKSPQEAFVGRVFADLSLQDGQGQEVPLRDLTKQGPLLVSLWATWCPPCLKELPLLEERRTWLEERGTRVLLVNYEGGVPEQAREQAHKWLQDQGLKLQTYFDPREGLLQALGLSALPFSFLLGTDGVMLWQHAGILDFEDLEKALSSNQAAL